MIKFIQILTLMVLTVLLTGCTSLPSGVKPVSNFKLNQYLGTWYEIARVDNSFERGLTKVTATYSLLDDGGVKVLNRGYNAKTDSWKQAEGRAYFVDSDKVGHLKVSFFGPFYSSYVVMDTDENHQQFAVVSGYNKDYLWLLSRTPQVSQQVMDEFIALAKNKGFNMDELITVNQ